MIIGHDVNDVGRPVLHFCRLFLPASAGNQERKQKNDPQQEGRDLPERKFNRSHNSDIFTMY
jgi:hypothetical protein